MLLKTDFGRKGTRWSGLKVVLILMSVLAVFLGFLVNYRMKVLAEKQAGAKLTERPPVNVVTLKVSTGMISDMIRLPGMIEPWTDLDLLAKISGEVVDVPLAEGDRVGEGQLIALIEQNDYQLALDEADVRLRKARLDYDRIKTLHGKKVIPDAEFEQYRSVYDLAEAAKAKAELYLSRCRIIAPISGIVRKLHVKKGSYLNVGDPVGKILRIDPVKAVVGIPESDVAAVRNIEEVELSIKALEDLRVTGRNTRVSVSPENMALLYTMELRLDNPENHILPGMYVRADIVKKQVMGLSIPIYSIISRNNEQYVYVVEEGVAKRRDVETGILQGWMVQITKGLQQGDLVVVEGHRNLDDGHVVKVFRELSGAEVIVP
ncbi:MAG: efflux RND transporter periplasmic adaptor subunit [Desulfobulbaceae bacterium]|nr:efflux RND transporter periplasmic adaptor subunit [Desulfobulbaceae bacterium]